MLKDTKTRTKYWPKVTTKCLISWQRCGRIMDDSKSQAIATNLKFKQALFSHSRNFEQSSRLQDAFQQTIQIKLQCVNFHTSFANV